MPRPTSVLLVFADQMRGEAMGCMGNAQVQTPNFDRFAGEGVRFTRAYANCPVCTPSRASLLTGRYPLGCRTLVNDLQMPQDNVTFAHALGGRGYRTGYVGKWHLDGWPRDQFTPPGPRRQGFDDFWAVYNCTHDYFHPRYYLDSPELVTAEGYDADVHTDLAIGFLERHRREPFCLTVSWGPPHNPYPMVPQEYRDRYDPEKLATRPNWGPEVKRQDVADYYAAVTALDANFGRLLSTLERLGRAEDTLVIFTSDHGDLLWSHGRTDKQAPWEEAIHIPLLMRLPGGLPAGATCEGLIGIADLMPTMLSLAGCPLPAGLEGQDLAAMSRGEGPGPYESVPIFDLVPTDNALRYDVRPWRGVRTARYTYARWPDGPWVLYDNEADPYQLHNLATEPAAAGLRAELEADTERWLERLGDPFAPTGDECLANLGQLEAWRARQAHFRGGGKW